MRSAGLALTLALTCGPAFAEADLFSRDTIQGLIDFRIAAADGETAWRDGAFGKARYGDEVTAEIADAAIVWTPRLSWSLSGHVDFEMQPDQDHGVDLVEAFVNWKPTPRSPTKLSGRVGLFYPHISQEHDGLAWGVTRTITPSAVNAWVGEEVKVIGAEVTVRRDVGGHQFGATFGAFGFNDTSGTLLAWRGWAMHDLKAPAFGDYPIPRVPPSRRGLRWQDIETEPIRDVDERVGGYVRADWTPPGPASFNAFYYDNAGSRTGVESGQWAWETRFVNVGMTLNLSEHTEVLAQVMSGETITGFPTARGWRLDVGYSAAYLLAAHRFGDSSVAGRVDWFQAVDRTFRDIDDNDEDGWALTGAYGLTLSPNARLMVEALHIASDRPARAYLGEDPEQKQTVLQSSLLLTF